MTSGNGGTVTSRSTTAASAPSYEEYHCKSVFNPGAYPDHWFWTHGSASAYRGCGHGCVYCDGRNATYGMDEQFSSRVRVKTNAPDIFKAELRKRFGQETTLESFGFESGPSDLFRPTVFFSSGVSDAYQPAETEYGLSRRLLEIARDFRLPVHVMTKSATVLRDLDILKEINKQSHCTVSFSVPTANNGFSRIFEPEASSPEERLDAVRKMADSGIHTGVNMMPMVPYFSDSDEDIRATVKAARHAGASYLLFGSMTLRDEQQEHFFTTLEKERPEEARKIKALYKGEYAPPGCYQKIIARRVIGAAQDEGLPVHLERHIPEYRFGAAKQAATALFQLTYFHEIAGDRGFASSAYLKAAREIETLRTDFSSAMKNGVIETLDTVTPVAFSALQEFEREGSIAELESFKNGEQWDSIFGCEVKCR